MKSRLSLPVYVVVNKNDCGGRDDSGMAWIGVSIDGLKCMPVFTTVANVEEFVRSKLPVNGGAHATICDGRKLSKILETVAPRPDAVVVDPSGDTKVTDVIDTGIVIGWLTTA